MIDLLRVFLRPSASGVLVRAPNYATHGEFFGIIMALILGRLKEAKEIIIHTDYENAVKRMNEEKRKEREFWSGKSWTI
jgi:hypothetical protein